ncbi:LacI family transcription regulator [uncultured Pleomorphomonas sp.]|uniref:LacI family transcription regulator n=1 Tax=uncultured Pleomorphomonas sp. TaxID=442121 RepID=A0A212LKZ2_9HYPH|nr:LacI family DNA-binding transcriptional regulator [uncultured Pleomorphomonas sp.]SCM78214.1 LacI family transcription regulator [uncultured Pleomorphomonas sp.]
MSLRKVTAREVARAADVSPATVDRVLNRRGGVAEDKEARVLEAAKRLGLSPSIAVRPSRTMRVALLMQPPANPFHAALKRAFDLAGRVYSDLNIQFLVYHIDPNEPARIAELIRKAAERHDGLIVTLPNHPSIAAALRDASARLPTITLATDIDDSNRSAYVGPDDLRAGRVAGDLMGRFLQPQGGDIVIIAGLRDIGGHRDRERGFREVLRQFHPESRVVAVVESGEKFDRAGDVIYTALRNNPGIKGVYHLSSGALPVVEAIRALGRQNDVKLITHELTEDRRGLLRTRAIDAIIDQNPEAEVRTAAETMARLLGRLEGTPQNTLISVQIYMPENA